MAPNLLNREFSASASNRKWVSDFAYIDTAEGWLYLAGVADLYSRIVVGWAMTDCMDVNLVEKLGRWLSQTDTLSKICCIIRIGAASTPAKFILAI